MYTCVFWSSPSKLLEFQNFQVEFLLAFETSAAGCNAGPLCTPDSKYMVQVSEVAEKGCSASNWLSMEGSCPASIPKATRTSSTSDGYDGHPGTVASSHKPARQVNVNPVALL